MTTPEPPPLQPPPRRVRLRREARGRVRLFRLASLPFIAAGLWLISIIIEGPVTRLVGTERVGTVTACHENARRKDGQHFDLAFWYDAGDGHGRRTEYDMLDTNGRPPPKVGDRVPIYTVPFAPMHRSVLRDAPREAGGYVCLGLFATLWCGMVGLFAAVAWLGPIAAARRVRTGVAVGGTIVAKQEVRAGRSTRLEVAYRYHDRMGQEQSATAMVRPAEYAGLEAGQAVTVLLAASGGGWPSLYETSDFETSG